jgi:Ca2+-binding EF-hand superfamily protein
MSAPRRRSNTNKPELSDQQKADILAAFSPFDTEQNGIISTKDLKVKNVSMLLFLLYYLIFA